MTDSLTFINSHWFWPVVFGSAVLLSVYAWKEWYTLLKKRRLLRIVLALVTVSSLAMIALKPAIHQTSEKGLAVLVTQGSDQNRLDSLINRHKNLRILQYRKGVPLQKRLDSVGSLLILGHGPAPFDIWQFEGMAVTYMGGKPLDGITKLSYDRVSTVGYELKIGGLFERPKPGNFLVLQAPGGLGLDSLVLEDTPIQNFNLTADLKVAGNYVYRLAEKDAAGKLLYSEPLPVWVKKKDLLNVLFINSFPNFETKYLKSYLAEKNHKVVVRSQLTQGKYKFEYLNGERAPIYGFSRENLNKFDILIIDASSYTNLSSNSSEALLGAVRDDGLGIFIQPDESYFQIPKKNSSFHFEQSQSTEVELLRWPKAKLGSYPFQFNNRFLLEPIQVSKEKIISAYTRSGKGRVGTTVFKNTYQLVLDGQAMAYKHIWSEIISAISRKTFSEMEWESETNFAVQSQPYYFKLRTNQLKPVVVNAMGSQIPLLQNPNFSNLWTGTVYPRYTGWNQLKIKGDSTSIYNFFVADSTNFKSLATNKTIDVNKREFDSTVPIAKKTKRLKPIDPRWFLLTFLLGMGWLWIDPKFFGQ